jgi:hypothetical protein
MDAQKYTEICYRTQNFHTQIKKNHYITGSYTNNEDTQKTKFAFKKSLISTQHNFCY